MFILSLVQQILAMATDIATEQQTTAIDAIWRYAGPLIGFGVAWGMTRSEVKSLEKAQLALTKDVTKLTESVGKLNQIVAVLRDRSIRHNTGNFPTADDDSNT